MNLKESRKLIALTQEEAAKIANIALRTYQNYENLDFYNGTLKYNYSCHY